VKDFINGIEVEEPKSFRNMAIFPIFVEEEDGLDYITLGESLEEGLVKITEKDEGGSVPEIKVKNGSKRRVLIVEGEELVRCKQNRIINTTILVEAQSELVIPVSCVERGR
jgi:hypothetical protein